MLYGDIVRATAGRDAPKCFVVLEERSGAVLICDGKRRPLMRPKQKNPKHVCPTGDRLSETDMHTDRAIRRALAEYDARADHSPS